MTVYEYFEYPGNIINDEVGVIAKRRSYLKTEYKFGDLEIFIWEEGIKWEMIYNTIFAQAVEN